MASSTTDIVIAPGAGWTLVAQSPGFLSIRGQANKDWFISFVGSGAGAPAASLIGEKITGGFYQVQEPITGDVYVRTLYNNQLEVTQGVTSSAPLGAGSSIIGKFGIDQTTQGVTNGVEPVGSPYNNITTATTTVVKSGAGVLHKLIINTAIASATITLYDNTAASGTKIGTITLPAVITGLSLIDLIYDLSFATGLTVVTSGLTDLTVIYR